LYYLEPPKQQQLQQQLQQQQPIQTAKDGEQKASLQHPAHQLLSWSPSKIGREVSEYREPNSASTDNDQNSITWFMLAGPWPCSP
jgi:hypothetical protein